jgi:ParB family chromosome partitioning protein
VTTQRGGLGRGLSALIPGASDESGLVEVPVQAVTPNRRQPRQAFDDETIDQLARSIREVGVLQPIVVRKADDGYELVAGERRLRAARRAGLATIPAIIRTTDDSESLREALIENIHREDLSALEQAAAFVELQQEMGATQEQLAERLGFSRPHVTNTMRLLQLTPPVQKLLADGAISAAHARALLGLDDPEAQETLALRIAAEGLNVRQTEELVKSYVVHPAARTKQQPAAKDATTLQFEEALGEALETRVQIHKTRRKGRIVISFGSKGDLERIVTRIAGD